MENFRIYLSAIAAAMAISCSEIPSEPAPSLAEGDATASRIELARMLAALPIGVEQMEEVHDAVSSSAGNGYDEEYTMKDLLTDPGAGVGDTKASGSYGTAMRDLIARYLSEKASTKASGFSAEKYLEALSESDMQIYWPYSQDWDGKTYPIVTFDPGFGAESNYGYEIRIGADGMRVVDSVYVDETIAAKRPVWVINRNDDSAYTPVEMLIKEKSTGTAPSSSVVKRRLLVKTFTMLRNYDSWFGGASEFFVKCGSVDGFKATSEAELKNYQAGVTDFMISVKRGYVGMAVPCETILLSDFTSQMSKLVFMITEDDGGTRTSWKCAAEVKVKSKTYGFDLEIPYNEKDDIVWRGQLDASFFEQEDEVTARFGDVRITFALE